MQSSTPQDTVTVVVRASALVEEGEITELIAERTEIERTKRSPPSLNDGSFQPVPRRQRKKLKKRAEHGVLLNPSDYYDIYGPDAHADVEVKVDELRARGGALKLAKLQELVLFALADAAIRPNWLFLRNKPLLSGVVLVMANGVTLTDFEQNKAQLPSLSTVNPAVPISPPGSTTHVYPAEPSLFRVPLGKRALEASAQPSVPQPVGTTPSHKPDDFLLSVQELELNNYPKPGDAGFVTTRARPEYSVAPAVVAMDCEMVITKEGYELARVSLLGADRSVLYDSVVVPRNPVLDHLTRYSGITQELLNQATATLEDAQAAVMQHVFSDTIIVGHSLENDLRALKMHHTRVVDTALLFADERGAGYKPALRRLASRYLGSAIQEDVHNPIEDALTALQLFQLRLERGAEIDIAPEQDTENLLDVLARYNKSSALVGRAELIARYVGKTSAAVVATDDDAVVSSVVRMAQQGKTHFIFAQLNQLAAAQRTHENEIAAADGSTDLAALEQGWNRRHVSELGQLDKRVGSILRDVPRNTFVIVLSASGNTARVHRLAKKRKEQTTDVEAELRAAVKAARDGVAWLKVKL